MINYKQSRHNSQHHQHQRYNSPCLLVLGLLLGELCWRSGRLTRNLISTQIGLPLQFLSSLSSSRRQTDRTTYRLVPIIIIRSGSLGSFHGSPTATASSVLFIPSTDGVLFNSPQTRLITFLFNHVTPCHRDLCRTRRWRSNCRSNQQFNNIHLRQRSINLLLSVSTWFVKILRIHIDLSSHFPQYLLSILQFPLACESLPLIDTPRHSNTNFEWTVELLFCNFEWWSSEAPSAGK